MQITINLSDAEHKALTSVAALPDDWINNMAHERCRIAIDEIVAITVQKCLDTNTQIPGSKDEMVELAFAQGWVKTAAKRNAEYETNKGLT